MSGSPCGRLGKRFLFQFANEHLDFRVAEFSAIADLFGIKLESGWQSKNIKDPFWEFQLSSSTDAEKLASRSMLVKSALELWGKGATYPEMYEDVRQNTAKHCMIPFCGNGASFKIKVDTYNKKQTQEYKVQRINDLPLDVFPLEGKIDLKNADHILQICENYGEDHNTAPDTPCMVYFGRWLVDGQREKIKTYNLKERLFLGHTSMDPCLSLLMANMGKCCKNTLVFDPFVGTGSLLVSAAQCGSYVMGTDIDYILLHAQGKPSRAKQKKRSKDESIRNNLLQYGLQQFYIDALVADASKSSLWDSRLQVDAIITDPPYGVREGAKKLGSEKNDPSLTEEDKDGHVPQKIDYHLSDVFRDLLNFAARFLRIEGRLVYWLPVYSPEYCEENIPRHPCLQLVSNCEQKLNSRISRRLITMEKCHECQVRLITLCFSGV
ncbi:hypothetical protein FSP39_012704 [Pinctada imbricata]|uniref:tRNA (guanine(10)-N(2))-methyltransferase TRMT11 n=1 Tax=Pinctada imbricata TaxID=66713 RepID=A0AA88XSR3_PINIB|nr:hypothetical protein FSP39_012704 [Pinctada imbricata]